MMTPSLFALAEQVARAKGPPFDQWKPQDCGDIPMRIASDGAWHYQGSPIERPSLVRLFARCLAREPDGRFVLMTPHEKVGIQVDDSPFVAVELARKGEGEKQRLAFRTNLNEAVVASAQFPLWLDSDEKNGFRPRVRVRGALDARLSRPLALEIAQWITQVNGRYGIWSSGRFFNVSDLR